MQISMILISKIFILVLDKLKIFKLSCRVKLFNILGQ
jgi:hypothetical protein